MKITKKPKPVKLTMVQTKSYYPKYVCPSCHVEFQGGNINRSTISFKCDCGQVLIVKEVVFET